MPSGLRSVSLVVVLVALTLPGPATASPQTPQAGAATAAGDTAPIEVGKPVERELKGGEVHVYTIRLEPGSYLRAVVDQKGVDVVATLFAPDGTKVVEVDSPKRTQGPEPVTAIAEAGGEYRLEVRSLQTTAGAGRYEARVVEVRVATETDRTLEEAGAIYRQSETLRRGGKLGEALPLAERAVALYEKARGPDHPDVATALNNLALLYRNQGAYAKAEPLFARSLAIREKALGPDHPDVAASLNNLAVLYRDQSAYAKAEPLLARALAISEKTRGLDHSDVATALNNLGWLYYNQGQYEKAEPLFERTRQNREKARGPEHPEVALCLDNLVVLYLSQGRHAEAEPLIARSLAIREKALGPEDPYVAQSLHNLAWLYESQGAYAKAEPLLIRALAILEKKYGPEYPNMVRSLNNLAELYRRQSAYAKAEPLLARALAISEKAHGLDHADVALSLKSLAWLYYDQGLYAKAEPLFSRALAIWEKALGPEHPDVATSLNNLAWLYRATGSLDKAVEAQARCNDVRERDLSGNLAAGSERRKLQYLHLSATELDFTISLHVSLATASPLALRIALETLLRRKGRALDAMTDAVERLRRHASPEDRKLLDELADARTRLAALSLKGPGAEGPEQHQADLSVLDERVDALESQIAMRSARFRAEFAATSLDAVQKAVPADSALVEFASYRPVDVTAARGKEYGPPRYVAYVLLDRGEPQWVELGAAAPIDAAAGRFREALRDPKRDVRVLARALDERIMRPVRRLLGPARHVLLSPDGTLNLVPFSALVDEQNRYLVERFAITYLTSGRDLLRLKERAPNRQPALVLAAPDFGLPAPATDPGTRGGAGRAIFDALPATAEEAREVAASLGDAKLLLGPDATKAALAAAAGPRLLHVATHGFFLRDDRSLEPERRSVRLVANEEGADPAALDPLLRSGLALAGANHSKDTGVLTATEASGLDLWGTKLVVLSACDTGVGEVRTGEGVYGLRRALLLAGSESQVMSLWDVADEATRELMAAYYARLKASEGRGEALRQVQLAMLKNPRRRHPFYWAAFILSGDWTPLDAKR